MAARCGCTYRRVNQIRLAHGLPTNRPIRFGTPRWRMLMLGLLRKYTPQDLARSLQMTEPCVRHWIKVHTQPPKHPPTEGDPR